MKSKILIIGGVMVSLVAGIGGGYWFAMNRMMAEMSAQADATVAAAGDKKPLYYYDPMYPQQKFDKPGKSPFMDMMLVPVYGDGGADNSSVKISSRIVQNLGIRLGTVTRGTLDKKIEVAGAIAFDERAVAVVQARVNGYVEKLFVRAPLDAVVKGQRLAEILAPDWVAAQEEYLSLRKNTLANDDLRQAARQRLILLGMAESTVAGIEADGRVRPRITLFAPVSGVVTELGAREGMAVAPGATLFRINGLSTVWINADVPETQAAELKLGSAIEATVPAYPGEVFKGRVQALLPDVNAITRTLKARIEVANPQQRLTPGMFATIAISSSVASDMLLVPTEAVIETGKRRVVIIADQAQDGKQQFIPADVVIGMEANGMTEIKRGLKPGMKIVLSGQFLIDSEASLKGTISRMSDAPVAADDGEKKAEAKK
jgi:membrane fusion protein, copper/silver efflux system